MAKKEWLTKGDYSMGEYDENNYYVSNGDDIKYFKDISHALLYLSDKLSRTHAKDIEGYLLELRSTNNALMRAVQGV